jgi:hypothetical protein
VHPVFPTFPKLVDFLNYLFKERELSVSAIKGYKSALSTSLRLIGCWGKCLGRHVYDSSSEHVGSTPKGPFLGSQSSMKEPFEPMDRASLKYVTLKTVY